MGNLTELMPFQCQGGVVGKRRDMALGWEAVLNVGKPELVLSPRQAGAEGFSGSWTSGTMGNRGGAEN